MGCVARLDNDVVILLDMGTTVEYKTAHLLDALSTPLIEMTWRHHKLLQDKTIVAYFHLEIRVRIVQVPGCSDNTTCTFGRLRNEVR